jgi:hypothetical protein
MFGTKGNVCNAFWNLNFGISEVFMHKVMNFGWATEIPICIWCGKKVAEELDEDAVMMNCASHNETLKEATYVISEVLKDEFCKFIILAAERLKNGNK